MLFSAGSVRRQVIGLTMTQGGLSVPVRSSHDGDDENLEPEEARAKSDIARKSSVTGSLWFASSVLSASVSSVGIWRSMYLWMDLIAAEKVDIAVLASSSGTFSR
ncbi:hypothetical protein NE237_010614 [Protea cynaroides]|uniref:Uncharacterized protein n=1 Tax=Protea cynaroides TaxID=273540 RepID=A0A9Q0L022_9MAGN|nr:hypothetical protein NE237_010614 [Protea cynaroides]